MSWWRFAQAVVRGEHRLAPVSWVAAIVTVVYTIWPLDFIPEMVLGPLGLVDDLGMWGIFLVLAGREKIRWEASVNAGAYESTGRDRMA